MMKSEANGLAGQDAIKRMFSAAKGGNWAEAAAAYKDFHVIVDDELGSSGGDDRGATEKPKEKRPLAAILIGGPEKK